MSSSETPDQGPPPPPPRSPDRLQSQLQLLTDRYTSPHVLRRENTPSSAVSVITPLANTDTNLSPSSAIGYTFLSSATPTSPKPDKTIALLGSASLPTVLQGPPPIHERTSSRPKLYQNLQLSTFPGRFTKNFLASASPATPTKEVSPRTVAFESGSSTPVSKTRPLPLNLRPGTPHASLRHPDNLPSPAPRSNSEGGLKSAPATRTEFPRPATNDWHYEASPAPSTAPSGQTSFDFGFEDEDEERVRSRREGAPSPSFPPSPATAKTPHNLSSLTTAFDPDPSPVTKEQEESWYIDALSPITPLSARLRRGGDSFFGEEARERRASLDVEPLRIRKRRGTFGTIGDARRSLADVVRGGLRGEGMDVDSPLSASVKKEAAEEKALRVIRVEGGCPDQYCERSGLFGFGSADGPGSEWEEVERVLGISDTPSAKRDFNREDGKKEPVRMSVEEINGDTIISIRIPGGREVVVDTGRGILA